MVNDMGGKLEDQNIGEYLNTFLNELNLNIKINMGWSSPVCYRESKFNLFSKLNRMIRNFKANNVAEV